MVHKTYIYRKVKIEQHVPHKNRGWTRVLWKVYSSDYISGTRHVTLIKKSAISCERGKEDAVVTTNNGTYLLRLTQSWWQKVN